MTIVEKAAYLKGLVEGLGVESDSREGKLWAALNDLLADMAHEIEDLQAASLDQADVIDGICEDLTYLEQITCDLDRTEDYEDLDDFDEEDFDEDGDGEDKVYRFSSYEDEDDDDEGEDDEELQYDGVLYDVTCPSCGEEITFDEQTLDQGSIKCPSCGEILEFDLGENKE